ncbi:MAG: RNA-binding cell elongation regulator Jag/EloR [Caldilineaceae bacterium]
MSEEGREFSGRSVDEAIASALQTLGLRSNQVQVEIINKGSRGLLGIGSTPALVRVKPLPVAEPVVNKVSKEEVEASEPTAAEVAPAVETVIEPPLADLITSVEPTAAQETKGMEEADATEVEAEEVVPGDEDSEEEYDNEGIEDEGSTEAAAVEMLSTMVTLMGFKVTVEPVWKDGDDEHDKRVLWLEIHGNNLSSLIGRRGETLENIQYLLRMMVNQRLHRWNDIVVDVDQYRTRRAEQISQLAQRLAEQALSAGRAMALEPMPPNERRIVHMALRNHPRVYTQSSGDGDRRKVYIVPKN